MRLKETYRAERRNKARKMLREMRAKGFKTTFRECFADAQGIRWRRFDPLPVVKDRPVRAKPNYPITGKREAARRLRQLARLNFN